MVDSLTTTLHELVISTQEEIDKLVTQGGNASSLHRERKHHAIYVDALRVFSRPVTRAPRPMKCYTCYAGLRQQCDCIACREGRGESVEL